MHTKCIFSFTIVISICLMINLRNSYFFPQRSINVNFYCGFVVEYDKIVSPVMVAFNFDIFAIMANKL